MSPSAAETSEVRQPDRIIRLIFLSTALFIMAAGFTLFLSSAILEELSQNIHFSAYRRVSERVQLSVERGLRFGRSLDGYSGLGEQLDRARSMAPGIAGLAVVDVTGSGRYISGTYPDRATVKDFIDSLPVDSSPSWRDSAEAKILVLPLAGRAAGVAGYLIVSADPGVFRRELKRFWVKSVVFLLAVAVLILLGQFICSKKKSTFFTGKASGRYWLCLLFSGGGQLLFGLPLVWIFSGSLSDAELAKVSITARTVAWDLDRLAAKTPRLKEIHGVDAYLDDVRNANPEIAAIRLRQGSDTMVAVGGDANVVEKPPALTKRLAEAEAPGGEGGVSLEFWLDSTGVRQVLRGILLTLATSLVISLLLLNEVARFFIMPTSDEAGGQGAGMSRMLAFVFFIAYDMPLSFIPLAAGSLPGGMGPFPDSMRTSLPLAAEAATAGLGILVAGRLARTGSARSGLFMGATFGAFGALIAWCAPTSMIFAGAFAVAGFGFGLFLMSCQAILLKEKGGAGGVAELYSGLFSGSLCGMAAGAMAAELFGFRDIFAVAMLCYLPVFLLIRRFGFRGRLARELPVGTRVAAVSMTPHATGEAGAGTRFYLSWPFLSQVILAAFPMAMSLGGLIFLSLPTLLNRIGAARGDTGRILMLYGLCFVFIGPRLGRRADSGRGYAPWIAGAAVMNGVAVLCVGLWPSYVSYAAAALFGGVACSLMTASGMARVAALSSASGVSVGSSGGLYRFVERMAQIVGPLLFGLFLSTDGATGFLWLGILFVVAAGLFYFTAEWGRIGRRGD